MTIYIEDNQYSNEVKDQLRKVVNGDKSLIISPTSVSIDDVKYFQVTYQPATTLVGPGNPDLGKALINKLANQSEKHIYIHGEHPFFRIPPVGGEDYVVQNEGGGFTTDTQRYPHVDLYVDGTENNQRYPITIEEPGFNSTEVFEDPYIRLYHEFLHAEGLIDRIPHSHPVIEPKVNQLRTQRGLGYEIEVPYCFIVSAASGSATSKEVEALQQIRNQLLRPNRIGHLIERRIYSAYMRFSPAVAQAIERSAELRWLILEIIVRPFIVFLDLTKGYAFETQDRRQLRSTIEQFRERLLERHTWAELAELSGLIASWASRLQSPPDPAIAMQDPPSRQGVNAERVLGWLSASINAAAPNDPYIIWATRPLSAIWEIVVDRGPCPEELFIDRVHGWVADLPLPDELRQLPPEAIADGLRELEQTALKHEPLRAALVRRIELERGGAGHYQPFAPASHGPEMEALRC
jgi:hypothetical protein